MIQQNKKNQPLGLSGSAMYNWQSKNTGTIGRKPSGASASRPQENGFDMYYKPKGVANQAGVPKYPSYGVSASPDYWKQAGKNMRDAAKNPMPWWNSQPQKLQKRPTSVEFEPGSLQDIEDTHPDDHRIKAVVRVRNANDGDNFTAEEKERLMNAGAGESLLNMAFPKPLIPPGIAQSTSLRGEPPISNMSDSIKHLSDAKPGEGYGVGVYNHDVINALKGTPYEQFLDPNYYTNKSRDILFSEVNKLLPSRQPAQKTSSTQPQQQPPQMPLSPTQALAMGGPLTNQGTPAAPAAMPEVDDRFADLADQAAANNRNLKFSQLPIGQQEAYRRYNPQGSVEDQEKAAEFAAQNPWAGIPNRFKKLYEDRLKAGKHSMSPQDAAKYYWNNYYTADKDAHYAQIEKEKAARKGEGDFDIGSPANQLLLSGIPKELVQKYRDNLSKGGTSVTPQDLSQAWDQGAFNEDGSPVTRQQPTAGQYVSGPNLPGSPQDQASQRIRQLYGMANNPLTVDGKQLPPLSQEQFDRILAEGQMDEAALKKRIEDSRRQLGFTGAVINEDRVNDLNNRSSAMAADSTRTQEFLENQQNNPGLKSRPSSTGFGTGEQASQAAGDFRGMAAAEKARRDEYNAEQDRAWDKSRASISAQDQKMASELGITNIGEAKQSMAKLAAEYNIYQRANEKGGRMSFTEWIAAKRDSGDPQLSGDSDLMKLIEGNYGPITLDSNVDKLASGEGNIEKWRAERDVDRQKVKANQDMLRNQRVQQAAAGANNSAQIAGLVARGYTPQQAANMVGMAAREAAERAAKIRAATDPALIAAAAEIEKARLLLEAQKTPKPVTPEDIDRVRSEVMAMYPGDDINRKGSRANQEFENRMKILRGETSLNDPYGTAKAVGSQSPSPQPGSDSTSSTSPGATPKKSGRTPDESATMVDGVFSMVSSDESLGDKKNLINVSSALRKYGESEKLDINERRDLASKMLGVPLNDPTVAAEKLREIYNSILASAKNAGAGGAGLFSSTGKRDYDAAMATVIAGHQPMIDVLSSVIPKQQLDAMNEKLKVSAGISRKNAETPYLWDKDKELPIGWNSETKSFQTPGIKKAGAVLADWWYNQ